MAARIAFSTEPDAWTFVDGGVSVRVTAPVLHGTRADGVAFSTQLSFESATLQSRKLRLPGQQEEVDDYALCGATTVPAGPSLDWVLHLVPQSAGLLLQLELTPRGGEDRGATLEHISLGDVEREGSGAASSPSSTKVASAKTRSILSYTAAAAASVVAVVTLPPAGAVAATALAASAHYLSGGKRDAARASFLINGWQSFSFAGTVRADDAQPVTSLAFFSGAFHTGAAPPQAPPPAPQHGLVSDLFAVLLSHRKGGGADEVGGAGEGGGLLLGFVTADRGVGGVATIRDRPDAGTLFVEQRAQLSSAVQTDWAMILPIHHDAGVPTDPSAACIPALHKHAEYMEALARYSTVPPSCAGRGEEPAFGRGTPVGWCSWYCNGPQVSEPLMLETISQLGEARSSGSLPLELVQLDDGWQSAWGDWTIPHAKRFPSGLKPVVAAATEAGLIAGLWIAPAALTTGSRLISEHPEWVLRDASGRPVKCGFTAPGVWIHAIDATHPGAIGYVRTVIRTAVHVWGFRYLKLDFLHTAAMPGGVPHDPTITRAAALHGLMAAVREEAGEDVFVLACGAPLGPCIGHVDGLRVSADAATHWLPTGIDLPGTRWFFADDRTNLPAARNMVRNVGVRMPMGGRLWRNDPDCLILREAGVDFTLAQAQALTSVAALAAGALIFSDPPGSLPAARLAVLQRVLPPLPRAGVAADLLRREIPAQIVVPLCAADREGDPTERTSADAWWLAALFNWSSAPATAGGDGPAGVQLRTLLAASEAAASGRSGKPPPRLVEQSIEGWHAFDVWTGTYERLTGASPVLMPPEVPPRCGWVVALRPVRSNSAPQFVGSDVHLSCGLEVSRLAYDSGVLELRLNAGRAVEAPCVWLYLPGTVEERPPRVEASKEGGQPLPAPRWVGDSVWVFTCASIGREGVSSLHCIRF